MNVKCQTCGEQYDDLQSWTLCPHNSLSVPADAVYCRRHDFYNCPYCLPGRTADALNLVQIGHARKRRKIVNPKS